MSVAIARWTAAATTAALLLAGCASGPAPGLLNSRAAAGLDYASAVCGQCHAVRVGEPSPNPLAPRFTDIARDYSDYGLDMEFDALAAVGHFAMQPRLIPPAERQRLKAYILRLKARQGAQAD